jgi:hypothetical protein
MKQIILPDLVNVETFTLSDKLNFDRWCITCILPDGKNYFCGIGEKILPDGKRVVGNIWSTEISECTLNNNGVFFRHDEVEFFLEKFIKADTPDATIEPLFPAPVQPVHTPPSLWKRAIKWLSLFINKIKRKAK